MLLQILRPSPLPPWVRLLDRSTRYSRSNRWSNASSGTPGLLASILEGASIPFDAVAAEGLIPIDVARDGLGLVCYLTTPSKPFAGKQPLVLFVHGGRIVFERYAPGFDRSSRFQSWSMARSGP